MSKLAWTSFLSIAADIILIFVIFIAAFSASKEQDKHFQANDLSEINTSMFAGVGTMSFAFVCQHNSFLVFQTLKSPTVAEWKKVANISISFSYTLCLALGLIGFFAFFPYVQGDLLNNFPVGSYEVSVARAFLGISMVFTFPMECFVSRHCLLTLFHRWMKDHQNHINSGSVSEANNHQDGDIELSSVVVDLESDLEDEMVVDNFNPLQQKQDKMPSSGKRPQNLPSSSKKNQKSNKKNNNSKNNKYQLVNQSFFSLEDSLHGSKDENQNTIIDFSETTDPNNRSNNTTTNINEFNRTELTVATIILWGLTLLISLLFKKLGVVSALTGVAAASSLGYTIPALIFIKSFYYDFLQLFHAIFVPEDRTIGGSSLHANPNEQHQVTQGTSSSSIPSLAIIYLNLSALKAFLMRFGLPLFMIFFGIMTLTIGVTTIIVQESSAG
jgi:amino acid permease